MTRNITHGRKRWALLAAPAFTLAAGIAAWAALSLNLPFVGSVSGADIQATAQYGAVSPTTSNDPACTWSITGGSDTAGNTLRLDATKVGRPPVVTMCQTLLSIHNTGEAQFKVQGFTVTSTIGTVSAGLAAADCGAVIAPGGFTQVTPTVKIANVSAGTSGTLTGQLQVVQTADYNPAACAVLP